MGVLSRAQPHGNTQVIVVTYLEALTAIEQSAVCTARSCCDVQLAAVATTLRFIRNKSPRRYCGAWAQ